MQPINRLAILLLLTAAVCLGADQPVIANATDEADAQLIVVLQDLMAQITLLQDRIASLEAKVAALESGRHPHTKKTPPPSSGKDPVMHIESIEPMPVDQMLLKEAAILEADAKVCDTKAERLENWNRNTPSFQEVLGAAKMTLANWSMTTVACDKKLVMKL